MSAAGETLIQLRTYYKTHHPAKDKGQITLSYKSELDKIIERIVEQIQNGTLKAGDVDPELWQLVNDRLYAGVEAGYGTKLVDANKSADVNMLNSLRKNVAVFSGFKNYQFLRAASDLLIDPVTNQVKPFAQFKADILALNNEYNVTFLSAEYNHAVATSQMASKWAQFDEDKNTLPLLEYMTVGDGRVRIAHQPLDGVIKPVGDPFWDVYMPPNDWNCRCTVRQLAEGEVTKTKPEDLPQLKRMFQNNPGKSGVVFPESHPYYNVQPEDQERADDNFGLG